MIEMFCNTTMDVYSVTETQSDTGGLVETETLKLSAVPCVIEIATGTERSLLGREGIEKTHTIFTPPGYSIVPKDRIKSDGVTYDVTLVDDVQQRNDHLEIAATVRL